jgi:8-oxo-dGTP diphosphatase
MNQEIIRPKVGVGVFICRDGKILLGKKQPGTNGEGTWCPPGGHLEWQETWEECVVRETLEEAGVDIENIQFMTAINTPHGYSDQHYITILMRADWKSGEAELLEPHVFAEWRWFDWDALPEPLYLFAQSFVETGINPLEFGTLKG